MKTLNNIKKENISTTLSQIGPNSWRVSQTYLGNTLKQLGINYFSTLEKAENKFNSLTK